MSNNLTDRNSPGMPALVCIRSASIWLFSPQPIIMLENKFESRHFAAYFSRLVETTCVFKSMIARIQKMRKKTTVSNFQLHTFIAPQYAH